MNKHQHNIVGSHRLCHSCFDFWNFVRKG